jgi:membrane-bound ClpP family serine protease
VVNVDNEYWSAVTADRIAEGDSVSVVSVEADKVTLRVKKD